ncbi:transmembrane signal receptor [Lithospermum erythrorhizon]|uniref:Transmembrane signal receptor n=1 Tax=Lithospermum erythrorhizon TaxID=34254 RepID=A0AAV3RCF5_LITER
MKPPPGFEQGMAGKVCHLQKSLYGPKQAPRCWFAKLASSLRSYDFCNSYSDYSLFSYVRGDIRLHVLIYVDHLIISSNNSTALSAFKDYLSSCFHMKDLGVLNSEGIYLCQRKYALDIIVECGLLGGRPDGFPMEPNHKLGEYASPLLDDSEQYRRLKPKQDHWDAALRVVWYLKNSPGQGILLGSDSDLTLSGWCDSDWASCHMTRRSLTGWLAFLGGSPILWKTKKQKTISLSFSEAEYRSLTMLTYGLK